jgi:hypothetical protein
MLLMPEPEGPEETTAWMLTGGERLASGERVVVVQHEPLGRTVHVSTNKNPAGYDWAADRPVRLARRAR